MKKQNGMKTINRNAWTRESSATPYKPRIPNMMRSKTPTGILTGRMRVNQPTSMPVNNPMENKMEKRGGKRMVPFLSNTGPGMKNNGY